MHIAHIDSGIHGDRGEHDWKEVILPALLFLFTLLALSWVSV